MRELERDELFALLERDELFALIEYHTNKLIYTVKEENYKIRMHELVMACESIFIFANAILEKSSGE